MDERIVAPIAVTLSEVGGSAGLVLAATDPLIRTSWLQFSGDHALIMLVFWALMIVVGFMIGPHVWRKRRTLKNKLKFLAVLWFIGVVADNTIVNSITAEVTGGIGWGTIPVLDLLMRSLIGSLLFWFTVLVVYFVENRRQLSTREHLPMLRD